MGVAILQARTCWACRESSNRVGSSVSQWGSEYLVQQEVWGVLVSLLRVVGSLLTKTASSHWMWCSGPVAGTEAHWMSFQPCHPGSPSFLRCSSSALYGESLTFCSLAGEMFKGTLLFSQSIYWRGKLELSGNKLLTGTVTIDTVHFFMWFCISSFVKCLFKPTFFFFFFKESLS